MTDQDLKRHVETALEWEPSLDAKDIGVAADHGVITLRGTVPSYAEQTIAERVALGVFGVKGIADDLTVHIPSAYERTDTELAQAAVAALDGRCAVPKGVVAVKVADGRITLTGTVEWQYQKEAAAAVCGELTGVRGINNQIALRPTVRPADVREKIEAAFRRSAEVDARRINVTAVDGKVILNGNVRSWNERIEAARAAWSAPGVQQVLDRLIVVP